MEVLGFGMGDIEVCVSRTCSTTPQGPHALPLWAIRP